MYKYSFAKKLLLKTSFKAWTLITLTLIISLLCFSWAIYNNPFGIWGQYKIVDWLILISIISLARILYIKISPYFEDFFDRRMDVYLSDYEKANKGVKGEEEIFNFLDSFLDKNKFTLLKNVKLPNINSDIDFVVIGPTGITIIEAKNHFTTTIFTKNETYYIKDGKRAKLWRDVRESVNWQSDMLRIYLNEFGITNIQINKVAVFLNPEYVVIEDYSENNFKVYIALGIDGLRGYLQKSFINKQFGLEVQKSIIDLLSKISVS